MFNSELYTQKKLFQLDLLNRTEMDLFSIFL